MNKDFRPIVIGYGVQGKKRAKIIGSNLVAIIDNNNIKTDYNNVYEVPLETYNIALVCTGDKEKIEIIKYLLTNKKHVLVEKPLLTNDPQHLIEMKNLAKSNKVVCYTAYNHRFEPHIIKMAKVLKNKELGKIYTIRMFYGNGTARLVRDSLWRDKGSGVLSDLGSHLFDILDYWFEDVRDIKFTVVGAFTHENKSFDNVILLGQRKFPIQLEVSLVSWRNSFTCDIFSENGSAHINSFCKWGPSTLTLRKRIFPSGKPLEQKFLTKKNDPTWLKEYEYFLKLCKKNDYESLDKDIWLNNLIKNLSKTVNINKIL